VDADALARGRAEAELVQALGRARHLRRPGVALVVAAAEAPTGRDLPGVVWTVAEASTAPAGARWARVDAAELAETHLARHGWIAVARLVAEGVGRRPAAAAARLVARARGLARVGGLPSGVVAYAARGDLDAEAAAYEWAVEKPMIPGACADICSKKRAGARVEDSAQAHDIVEDSTTKARPGGRHPGETGDLSPAPSADPGREARLGGGSEGQRAKVDPLCAHAERLVRTGEIDGVHTLDTLPGIVYVVITPPGDADHAPPSRHPDRPDRRRRLPAGEHR
jgi:hypothetical protein